MNPSLELFTYVFISTFLTIRSSILPELSHILTARVIRGWFIQRWNARKDLTQLGRCFVPKLSITFPFELDDVSSSPNYLPTFQPSFQLCPNAPRVPYMCWVPNTPDRYLFCKVTYILGQFGPDYGGHLSHSFFATKKDAHLCSQVWSLLLQDTFCAVDCP